MKEYLLPSARYDDIIQSIESGESNVVENHQSLIEWTKKLEATKTKLDKYYSDSEKGKVVDKIIKLFDHFKDDKYSISSEFNAQHVSNAWLKFWEILFYFKLIPRKQRIENFSVFCNACLPGSDILAINHFIKTKTVINKFDWFASSLIDKKFLQDDYNLHKNYPDNWLNGENGENTTNGEEEKESRGNGDVLSMTTQNLITEKLGGNMSLYTSDLGFDVSSNYNAQESLHAPYNLGQIVSAIVSLCDGGNMIVKMYTFFTPFSKSLLVILSSLFDSLHITKPVTSKPTNSEIYIVGIGYNYNDKIVNYLLKRLEQIEQDKSPFVNSSHIRNWKSYQTVFSSACTHIFGSQIKWIDHSIRLYEKYGDNIQKAKKEADTISDHFDIVDKWYIDYPLKKLRVEDRLNVE